MKKYIPLLLEIVKENDKFHFMHLSFHVGKADKIIHKCSHKKIKVNLKQLSSYFNIIKINKEYAMNLTKEEVNIPGIFLEDKENEFNMLIDGWHRAYNLYSNNQKYMYAYLINDPKEIKQITI